MKKILTLLICITIFQSCLNVEKSKGHWHIKKLTLDKSYNSLDLLKDSIAYLDKDSFIKTVTLKHSINEKYIQDNDCAGVFEYKIDGKKIHLKNKQNHLDYYGEKFELNNSHKFKDYMNSILLDVTFPEINNLNKFNLIDFENTPLIESIIIGNSKNSNNISLKKGHKIQVNNSFVELEDIDNWIESIKMSTSESKLDMIKFRIVSDKNVSLNLIKLINEKLKAKGFLKIYLTCLKLNPKESENLFEYIDLREINLNENLTIKDIMQQ